MANESQYPKTVAGPAEIENCLRLLLDQCDYTRHACRLMDMVGACIPKEVLDRCNKALGR